ncbi:glycoside hydrolase family 99-like domain-containing protein [Fuscibacter oryzae]|uniref:Glycoside hydrolase family 99-like domain-containing protein n=1 Tax=Fuscibacter oryzae TaxID=2803939 RepID=A0A8J7MU25_9RHOB|nr:glycoside hydrolase family 99-like domain-containing protein [Fuscibacter oryzae]MBL4929606.1 glycoside hydrolase family 99-like domain-containing protein [Fuscibacter oryzae]
MAEGLGRLRAFVRAMALGGAERRYRRAVLRSGLFDRAFYRGAYPGLNPIYRRFPENHFIVHGEGMGYRPNPDFVPHDYLRLNPDVAAAGLRPFLHFVTIGHAEGRPMRDVSPKEVLPAIEMPVLRLDPARAKAEQAIVVHVFYPDLWPEFRSILRGIEVGYDLFVTLTWRGEESDRLKALIQKDFPRATVVAVPNRGRDILPFLHLVNAGVLDGYRAVAKLHSKKSPHRVDGDQWRRHLIRGILPENGLATRLAAFLADDQAGIWVADGQHFKGAAWWGSNLACARQLLARIEVGVEAEALAFPAGSIYWLKPLVVGLLKSLRLTPQMFEEEAGQLDGTLAHAVERALGYLAASAGLQVRQASEVVARPAAQRVRPRLVSAFYLPQFHPVPENDAWWGRGYTEWRAAIAAPSCYAGHLQPMLPADLGFYDLRATEVMGAQAALARQAGVDAFCVYHYWFDGRQVLDAPLRGLLRRPEVEFPFYLCWANESWRRNWDGLSGEVLLNQSYAPGFEAALAENLARYMRDPRYLRPDGRRPRLMIYRPEDLPDPAANVARLRDALRGLGVGEVELGAVSFHIAGPQVVVADVFDFWVEMPPHGLVTAEDYLFGGPQGNRMPVPVSAGFRGLVYDYARVAARAVSPEYRAGLPANTIAGIMPGWDNTARRGMAAHIAYGAHPGSFRVWLRALMREGLAGSYRQELFINAWNEWGEKAVMEPSQTFGDLCLQVLAEATMAENMHRATAAGDGGQSMPRWATA